MRFQLLFYVLSLFIINRTLNAQTLKITYRLGHSCSFGQDENGDPMRGACTVDQEFIYRFKERRGALIARQFNTKRVQSKYEDGEFTVVSDKTKKCLLIKMIK
ncbi:MAG: hypothetical protein MK212_15920 [Saprospiraceae bacterium]|nr:hypothetical protein [Saprospiraceae bacterium]